MALRLVQSEVYHALDSPDTYLHQRIVCAEHLFRVSLPTFIIMCRGGNYPLQPRIKNGTNTGHKRYGYNKTD
jgi:hypothetical protein